VGQQASGNEIHRDTLERGHERSSKDGASAPKQRGDRSTESAIAVGKLIDYGPAHYRFDETKGQSFFVRLETRHGSELRWGVDLERAFTESKTRPQVGDEIGVELLGAKPVAVKANVFDETGRVVGEREIAKHRNSWLVEKREYFEQRARRAQALRDEGRKKDDVVREHPDLVGTVATVRLAELFAAQNIGGTRDQREFVRLVRDVLACGIEQELPMLTPKLRDTNARSHVDRQRDTIAASVTGQIAEGYFNVRS
jgi:hypothetical protein